MKHFGPIQAGEVEFKPLTILIGANNSGKTYVAQLLYILLKSLSAPPREAGRHFPSIHASSFSMTFREYLRFRFGSDIPRSRLSKMKKAYRVAIEGEMERFIDSLEQDLHSGLMEYFNVNELDELALASAMPSSFEVSIQGDEGGGAFARVGKNDTGTYVKLRRADLTTAEIPDLSVLRDMPIKLFAQSVVQDVWFRHAGRHGFTENAEFYLPSARSAIITAWPLLTSMAVSVVRRRLGPEPIEIAALSGVDGDFLGTLIGNFLSDVGVRRRPNPQMSRVLDVLEGEMLKGEIFVDSSQRGTSSLLYRLRDITLPLQRASSMVAELAPLDLWIRQLLAPGDLLIIDEPEAHLHPQQQLLMARVLVRLVRAGIRVVCPTHSSLILHQLSNHILARDVSPEERAKLGFAEDDILNSDDIAVYRFDVTAEGTKIRPVPILDGFGISEDEFTAVAEQIGDVSFALSISAARHGGH